VSRIVAKDLEQTYGSGGRTLTVLQDIQLSIEAREVVAIIGPSGSGKTTLLGLLAGLDLPSRGGVWLDGQSLNELDEDERAVLRARTVGFVFQSFQLLPTLTALENVCVPLELLSSRSADSAARARRLLERVGLAARADHYPAQLSGGEQQRVALARAFANEPSILFADEPTGNLDTETGRAVIELLLELNRDAGTALVLVTHDSELAARAHRIVRLSGGRIASDAKSAP
jgi:putative ABC transport system ATP-binding protein